MYDQWFQSSVLAGLAVFLSAAGVSVGDVAVSGVGILLAAAPVAIVGEAAAVAAE